MAKIISFTGSPGSGKTTVSLKTAIETYIGKSSERIVYISTDLNVPSVALLFPNYKPEEICSLGDILRKTTIDEDTVLRNAVTFKNMKDMVCLGYKSGDNRLSYPVPTPDKIKTMIDKIGNMSEYIFVDCSDDDRDEIAKIVLNKSDNIFRIITPDLKGMAWLSSHKNGKAIDILNITEKNSLLPVGDVYSVFDKKSVVIPFSQSVKQQMLDGNLYEMTNDKKYRNKIKEIVGMITDDNHTE